MAGKSSMPMGRRQKARIAQRRRRRLIAAIGLLLLCLLVAFLVWMSRESVSDTDGEGSEVTSSVTEDREGLLVPLETEPIRETEPIQGVVPSETEPVEETPAPQETEPVRETGSGLETQTPEADQSGKTETGGTSGKGNAGTTSNAGGGTSPSAQNAGTVTLKSGTLNCTVTTAAQGSQGKLTWKALDSKGKDITAKCSITYIAENCTVEGSTVTFQNVGTASITGRISYNGASVTTNAVSVEVTALPVVIPVPEPEPESVLTSVNLLCPVEIAGEGETAELTVTALDSVGKDITPDCTVSYTAAGCTVEGNTVTFGGMGTAEIAAVVTYQGVTLTTETVTVTVTGQLAAVTLSCTQEEGENSAVSLGDTATLSAKGMDANGNELTGCAILYSAPRAAVEGNQVTFDREGKVTITATATRGDVTVTSNTVTVYVDFNVILSKAGNMMVHMGQHLTNQRFGWYLCLPDLAQRQVEKDEDGKELADDSLVVYRYAGLDLTVSIASADREEESSDLREAYNARVAALTADGAQILSAEQAEGDGRYQITWQKDDAVTTERRYIGSASETTLTAVYPAEKREGAEQLMSIIFSTFQKGSLDVTHPTE